MMRRDWGVSAQRPDERPDTLSWRITPTLENVDTKYGTSTVSPIWTSRSIATSPFRIAVPWLIAISIAPTTTV